MTKRGWITIQENEYTGLQAYKAPQKGFRVYVKGSYSSSVKSSEHTFYANNTDYFGIRIGVTTAIIVALVGVFCAIRIDPAFTMMAIFGPVLVMLPTLGITQNEEYGYGSTACRTLKEALSKAIAYQEQICEEVKTSLEYNSYLRNLAEVNTTKVIEGSE